MRRFEKILVFIAVYAVWAAAYFGVGWWNAGRTAQVLAWDPVWYFPVVPAFVIPYLSAFILPFMVAASLREPAVFRRYAVMLVMVILASAMAFMLWPLAIVRPPIEGGGIFDRLLVWLYAVDKPVNLFPSLHVSMTFLFAKGASMARPRWHPWLMAWATLVAISTLFIRQHYFIDVIAGVLVAYAAWTLFQKKSRSH